MLILFDMYGFLNLRKIMMARLVGDGRSHVADVDCDETFSSVVKPTTIGIMFTVALSKFRVIHQLDLHNAFLHGDLHETSYIH